MFNFTDPINIGKSYKDFVLLSIDDLKDYKAKGVYLRHKITGLEVYHIIKDDKENLFAYAFRTVDKTSRGVAHIMEHSVLCGSEKYPLKEPFITLASTSLNTFLNALTYPDKTVYPGASVVRADYFNMMDVYGDAVFFPKLDKATFIQEGHRVEMDENGKLSIQGVVYNEMKGNYSSFQPIAFSDLISAMFPNSYPAFDSGGDPLHIPELTYQEFLDFHQKFYSPDNCLLFLYGDIPTEQQLDFIDERFISRLVKKYDCREGGAICNIDTNSKAPLIKKEIRELQKLEFLKESTEIKTYAPETGSTGSLVTLNWYAGKADMEKYFLSEALCGNDSSPLARALKDSKLGDDVQFQSFGQFKEEFYTAGLWGVQKGDEEKVFSLVEKTLNDIYENGVSQEDIDSAVMGIDFALREVNRYWGPFSIQLMEKALKGWCNGDSCASQLSPITSFEKVKQALRDDPDYTKKLIKKYFLEPDAVKVRFISEPSDKYFKEREEAEAALIEKLEKDIDRDQLKKELDELHAYQQHIETAEETACIPTTKISELDRKIDIPHTSLEFVKGADNSDIPLFVSKEDTNGIFYIDVLFPFDNLAPEYLQHVPFLADVITNLGWNGKGWDRCTAESSCIMGDIWGRTLCGSISDAPECLAEAEKYKDYNFCGRNWIGLICKALSEKAEEALNMLAEIITKMDFEDHKHLETLIGELKAEKKNSLISNGREYAQKRARAGWSPNLALNEIMWGISQLHTVSNYKKHDAKNLLKTFAYMYSECIKAGGIIHITADEDSLKKIRPLLQKFAKNAGLTKLVPIHNYTMAELKPYIWQADDADSDELQFIKVSGQTGYASAITPASQYLTKEAAAEIIFSSWVSSHTLWDKIRTTGGAYGASCWVDNIERQVIMTTYRDPTPFKSIKVYLNSLKELCSTPIPKEEVEKTIVSSYGNAIVPACPKDRGARSFEGMLYANPQDFKQKRVDNILEVTEEDVEKAADRIYEASVKKCSKAVFSNKTDKSEEFAGKIIKLPL